jgi:polar amino acid transport system substrate-binding protein
MEGEVMRHTRLRVMMAVGLAFGMLLTACSKSTGGDLNTVDTFGAKKDSALADKVPAALKSKGTLTVATDASYAPDEFFATDNKTIIGMSVDLGKSIGAVLGLNFNFVNTSFDTIIPGLQSGKFDIGISSFTDNKVREQIVDMADYFTAGESIFVKAGGKKYATLSDMCGLAISAERGTVEADDATAASKACQTAGKQPIKILLFSDQNGANLAVSSGRAVASLADSQVAAYQVKLSNGKFELAGEYVQPAPYGMACPKGNGLAQSVVAALTELKSNGIYGKILDRWGISVGALSSFTVDGATS